MFTLENLTQAEQEQLRESRQEIALHVIILASMLGVLIRTYMMSRLPLVFMVSGLLAASNTLMIIG
jgi:hypothetical protein